MALDYIVEYTSPGGWPEVWIPMAAFDVIGAAEYYANECTAKAYGVRIYRVVDLTEKSDGPEPTPEEYEASFQRAMRTVANAELVQSAKDALGAVSSLDEDALGFAERDGERWPIRDELRDKIARALDNTARPPMEVGWVIEHGKSEVSHPLYWCGAHGWSHDNLKAVRFSRKEDAESANEAMQDAELPNPVRIAEHGWG